MNRVRYRDLLGEAAYQGRRALERFVRRHLDLFGAFQREEIEVAWDIGGIAEAVVQEYRAARRLPADPNRPGTHATIQGNAVRSLISPAFFWPKRGNAKERFRERAGAPKRNPVPLSDLTGSGAVRLGQGPYA